MTTSADINREQFNRQAAVFARWSGTTDTVYLAGLADFIGVTATDRVCDVACGSGGFALSLAPRIAAVVGVDVSDTQAGMAGAQARAAGIRNAAFVCGDVVRLPLRAGAFSVVTCKAAFHHFRDPAAVVAEMARVCAPGGTLCIDDITAPADPAAARLLDAMDALIDISHHRRMSPEELTALVAARGIRVVRTRQQATERVLREYRAHALQAPENAAALARLVWDAVRSGAGASALYRRNGHVCFRNPSVTIVGTKPA